jgi:hypothetical protein
LRVAAPGGTVSAERAMESSGTKRVLVVANRTSATPWLLQEIEHRARSGSEIALLVPPTSGGTPDWTPDVARSLVEEAAGRRVRTVACGRDCVAAVRIALNERAYDEVLVSARPPRGPKWLRGDLVRRIDALGVPVTEVVPGVRSEVDHTVLKVRWDDGGP